MGTPLALTGITWTRRHKDTKTESASTASLIVDCGSTCSLSVHCLLTHLKGVFSESRQAVVHGASCTGVDNYLSNLIRFTQLRRSIWLHNAHQSCKDRQKTLGKNGLPDSKLFN